MIIWGSKGRKTTVDRGQFLCPQCRAVRPYERKKVAKYFTLYFIPIFETEKYGEYIECQVCQGTFRTEVLAQAQSIQQELDHQQRATRAARVLSEKLESGVPMNMIAASLKEAGLDEQSAALALFKATEGKIKVCQDCGLSYSATLQFCSSCGRALSSPSS